MPQVATLLGHFHLRMAIRSLGSLAAYSKEPCTFRLHDDGTLTEEDVSRLRETLPVESIVWREEADDQMDVALAPYPALAKARQNPLMLKLLDVSLLADGWLCYCDTDVLFLRPFSGLFAPPQGVSAIFMRDKQNAYSVRSWHVATDRRLKLLERVNTGIICADLAIVDLDLLEWFFSKDQYRWLAQVWIEQTAWSLLAARVSTNLYDKTQLPVADVQSNLNHAVGVHFVSTCRHRINDAVTHSGVTPVQVIRSSPAQRLSTMNMAATEASRRLGRLHSAIADRIA